MKRKGKKEGKKGKLSWVNLLHTTFWALCQALSQTGSDLISQHPCERVFILCTKKLRFKEVRLHSGDAASM